VYDRRFKMGSGHKYEDGGSGEGVRIGKGGPRMSWRNLVVSLVPKCHQNTLISRLGLIKGKLSLHFRNKVNFYAFLKQKCFVFYSNFLLKIRTDFIASCFNKISTD